MKFTKALSIHANCSIAVITLATLGIAAANAQQAASPPNSASSSATRPSESSARSSDGGAPVNKGATTQGSKPAHGDHCQDRANTATSGKSDCERSSPSDADRTVNSSSSSSSSAQAADSSTRSTTHPSSSRSATSLPGRTASNRPTPSAPPAPPTPNAASSSQAQTTPQPVEHEPPANGPGSKSAPAPRP